MVNQDMTDLGRIRTGQIELGVSDALQKHISRQVVHQKPVSQQKLDFEHKRPRILREMVAEATGVFIYVFAGIASLATLTLASTNPDIEPGSVSQYGSLLQTAFSFGFGIAFAIIIAASTSGGHFNPALTISFAVWQGFPWKKVPLYIISQIFGAFMAGMLLMGCYWPEIQAAKAINIAQEGTAVFNGGVASILCTFPNASQRNQGYLFFQEFFVCSYIGLLIWACLDPANNFVSPQSVPMTIGLVYTTMVMGFGYNAISTNMARDLGPRIVAAIFFGREAFTYDNGYCWIAILVNVPATLFATGFYELVMRDSLKKIGGGHAEHEDGDEGLKRHISRVTGETFPDFDHDHDHRYDKGDDHQDDSGDDSKTLEYQQQYQHGGGEDNIRFANGGGISRRGNYAHRIADVA